MYKKLAISCIDRNIDRYENQIFPRQKTYSIKNFIFHNESEEQDFELKEFIF